MCWYSRRKEDSAGAYKRLAPPPPLEKVPRGCVPVLVGDGSGGLPERFVVKVKVLNNPGIAALLEIGAEEFGERQVGVLRIPCDAEHFRHVLSVISASKSRR